MAIKQLAKQSRQSYRLYHRFGPKEFSGRTILLSCHSPNCTHTLLLQRERLIPPQEVIVWQTCWLYDVHNWNECGLVAFVVYICNRFVTDSALPKSLISRILVAYIICSAIRHDFITTNCSQEI